MSRLGVSGLGSQKKYGLILPTKSPPSKTSSGPTKKPPLKNIFGQPDDDDDEEEEEEDDSRKRKAPIQQMAEHRQKKMERVANQALAEDASVFDYDSVQPSFAAARVDQQQQQAEKQVERKSQYIATLLKKAEFRTKEQDLILEKKRVKDRQQEDHLYAGKEKFVTSAYKKKLQEEQRWLEEQNARDALDAANDVTKKTGGGSHAMLSFYSNVLNAGGATRSHIVEEKTKMESGPATAAATPTAESHDTRKRTGRSRSPSPDRDRARGRDTGSERDPKRIKAGDKPSTSPRPTTATTPTPPTPSHNTPTEVKPESDTTTASASAPAPASVGDPAVSSAEARKQKAEEARRKYMERKKAAQG